MKKYRPAYVSANEVWKVTHQIIVPSCYRKEILSLAHDYIGGHLGINKTYNKILQHFYWPKLKKYVTAYCNSCHTCQLSGKPNQPIKPFPLQPIPVVEEPFSKILIDCVGPLPKSRSGNQSILTIMCTSTRYPEAIPSRNITSKTVVKALTKFFTQFGVPKTVQSDQSSNFTSGLFQEAMHQLGIQQYFSTAYHPESQGAIERLHQTLKCMMKKYCLE